MVKYKQLVTGQAMGDCFRACMATLLQLPPQVLPNDHSPYYHWNWQTYLRQFGLALSPDHNAQGAIWHEEPWIASVKSLNYPCTHAILMHEGGKVLWDPSRLKRYRTGMSLLGGDVVVSGRHLMVSDTSKLHKLEEYRQHLARFEVVAPPPKG